MNYLDIKHVNMVNGEGLRTVIWVSGCSRNCPGCFSPHTHDKNGGIPFDDKAKEELFRDSKEDWCDGITFLGGEPLEHYNIDTIVELAREHKERFPCKTIWLYSGYTYNEIINSPKLSTVLKYIDVLCSGPFVQELKSPDLKWVGSSNQEVIDIKKRITQVVNILD